MSALTGRQRYRQALLKQKLTFARQSRELERGERKSISCPIDEFIKAELDNAYARGVEAGRREAGR